MSKTAIYLDSRRAAIQARRASNEKLQDPGSQYRLVAS